MKMDIGPMQPQHASSVASTDNVTLQTDDAASTNGGKKTSWVWTYFVRLREKVKAVCHVPKLRGGSAICGATYVCTAMSVIKNLAKYLMTKHQTHDKIPEQGAMRAYLKPGNLKVCVSHKLMKLSLIWYQHDNI